MGNNKSRKPIPESILEANMKGFIESFKKHADANIEKDRWKLVEIQIDREKSFEQIQKSTVITQVHVKRILDFITTNPQFEAQTEKFLDYSIELLSQCLALQQEKNREVIESVSIEGVGSGNLIADYWPKQ